MIADTSAETLLDYGAGKQVLERSLRFEPIEVRSYDPAVAAISAAPEPAHIVVCTDVMEHVEPDYTVNVLRDIFSLAQRAVYFDVCVLPSAKTLPDGRNTHINLMSVEKWLALMLDVGYQVVTVHRHQAGFWGIFQCLESS